MCVDVYDLCGERRYVVILGLASRYGAQADRTTVALGGWITTFMLRVRHAEAFASGMAATGFWLGLTVRRFTLGFLTRRVGERLAVSVSLFSLHYDPSSSN